MNRESAVRIGLVFPDLLGTYGDRGNALVLAERCTRRDVPTEVVEVHGGSPIPDSLDVYLFGGGEDDAQVMAADGMRRSRSSIDRAHRGGAVVFAVCAGFQLLGQTYEARDGSVLDGLGIVEMDTRSGTPRLIGEVVVAPDPATRLPTLTGFENHGGRTTLGDSARALGSVVVGHGNGVDGVDGVVADRILGTYLHGPALPRNPALADFLLEPVIGDAVRKPLDDTLSMALRAQRLGDAMLTGIAAKVRDWKINRG